MAEYAELNGTALLLYSELVDNAVAMEADASPSDGFGFILKKVQRGEYWYLQQTLGGKKKQYFFGPDTKDVRQRIDDQKQRWEEKRLDQAATASLVGATIAAGCSATNHRAYKVLNAVASSGLFRAGGVLVGSHAFVAIGNMIGVSWVRDTTVTDDVDLAASLLNPRRTPLSARANSPHTGSFIDEDRRDEEVVDLDPRVMVLVLLFRIRDRRPNELCNRLCDTFRGMHQ